MPGLLSFHAHPDDEVIQTGGILAQASDDGRPTMVVTATDGAEGEIHNYDDPDAIRPRLAEVRAEEIAASMSILGVDEQHFLGYRDSGMMGEDPNFHPDSFWQADFDDAVGRVVAHIRRFRPDVMTIYDPHGGYGHPDHIQVHRVGLAAFWAAQDLARYPLADDEEPWLVPKLYWSTWPRSRRRRFAEMRLAAGEITEEEYEAAAVSGTPDELLTAVNCANWVDTKLKALRAHRSQIPEDWFMLRIDEDMREEVVGLESFYRVHSSVDVADDGDLFAGL
ncbi:MAG TPA: PIG-L family deacetylase [Acidimicrobiia bacterium]|nr:PIG-L family deacetylase [Acidimicrobiia bacterium]